MIICLKLIGIVCFVVFMWVWVTNYLDRKAWDKTAGRKDGTE